MGSKTHMAVLAREFDTQMRILEKYGNTQPLAEKCCSVLDKGQTDAQKILASQTIPRILPTFHADINNAANGDGKHLHPAVLALAMKAIDIFADVILPHSDVFVANDYISAIEALGCRAPAGMGAIDKHALDKDLLFYIADLALWKAQDWEICSSEPLRAKLQMLEWSVQHACDVASKLKQSDIPFYEFLEPKGSTLYLPGITPITSDVIIEYLERGFFILGDRDRESFESIKKWYAYLGRSDDNERVVGFDLHVTRIVCDNRNDFRVLDFILRFNSEFRHYLKEHIDAGNVEKKAVINEIDVMFLNANHTLRRPGNSH